MKPHEIRSIARKHGLYDFEDKTQFLLKINCDDSLIDGDGILLVAVLCLEIYCDGRSRSVQHATHVALKNFLFELLGDEWINAMEIVYPVFGKE